MFEYGLKLYGNGVVPVAAARPLHSPVTTRHRWAARPAPAAPARAGRRPALAAAGSKRKSNSNFVPRSIDHPAA